NSLDVQDGRVYVAGNFTTAGNLAPVPWDGTNSVTARSLAVFDGTNWSRFYDTNGFGFALRECFGFAFCNEVINGVRARGSNVFAIGSFNDLSGDAIFDASAEWSGTNWLSWGFKYGVNGGGVFAIASDTNHVYLAGG